MRTRRAVTSKGLLLLTVCPLAIATPMLGARAQDAAGPTAGASAPASTAAAKHRKPMHRRAAHRGGTTAGRAAAVPAAGTAAVMPAAQAAPSRGAAISGNGGMMQSNAAQPDESVIVTGTRSLNKKARDSTSPIDVISAQALSRTGQPTLQDQLSRTDPSINVKASGNDTEALVAAIQLRGLNPNETLVLVDGVRRHPTSNIFADAGPATGATPVDINMIPAAAIDHIEVLRDGAAAQYGSDAIAGVVNVILKKTDHGTHASAFTGADAYNGDGWQTQLDADQGAAFGQDGYVHLGGQFYHTDFFVTQTVDDRLPGLGVPVNSNKINSTPEETRETLSIEAGDTLAPNLFGGLQGYSLITYGHRHTEAYENYRLPSVLPQIYPNGFSPLETDEENDFSALLGLKADDFFGFHVNLSTVYGQDNANIGNKNTGNPDLETTADGTPYYPPFFTPTTVLAQSQKTSQWTNNLDFTKPLVAFSKRMNIAFGAEERSEVYRLGPGAPASYLDGGTQAFAGLLPANSGSFSRNVIAGYIDYDVHPLAKWDVDLAGRFEHYTDSGNTETGKLSTRYDFTKWIAIRGTISNGFRAPTLAEENYSALNVSPSGASGILAANSEAARLIGATPLKPERSTNASAGIVLQPLRNLDVTADIYQINLRDRIVAAGGLSGVPAAAQAIAASGATLPPDLNPADISAYYFANGASTRTQGADVDINYFSDFRNRGLGTVTWTAGIDLNRTRLTKNDLDSTGGTDLNAQSIGYITTATPRSKIILDAFWRLGKFDFNVRQTRWGEAKNDLTFEDTAPKALQFSSSVFQEFKTLPVWTTDLQVGYQISPSWHASIGANNILNEKPRRTPEELAYLNVAYYDNTASTLPITGGFYYGQINYVFP